MVLPLSRQTTLHLIRTLALPFTCLSLCSLAFQLPPADVMSRLVLGLGCMAMLMACAARSTSQMGPSSPRGMDSIIGNRMDLFFLVGYLLCVGVVVQSVVVYNRVKNLCVVKTVQGTTNVLDDCVLQTKMIDKVCFGVFHAVLYIVCSLYAMLTACSLGSASKRGAVDRARLHGVPVTDGTTSRSENDDIFDDDESSVSVSPNPREYN